MAAPFDDQLILDLRQTVTYTPSVGSPVSVSGVTVQEQGVQTIQTGLLSLVARDARITFGMTQFTGRPAEGARCTTTDGLVWQFVSVIKRELGNFWEIIGRTFSVPGGLPDSGTLYNRNSTPVTSKGLNDPTWTALESNIACHLELDGQQADNTIEPVESLITGRVLAEGYREFRPGRRFALSTAPTQYWDVDGAEPYEPTLGVQILRVSRRI